ncbi:MAG TPA: flagellar hook basal-body protein [Bryobacteraceae bacterium]|jgi:flagellar basal body rod protein FlgG
MEALTAMAASGLRVRTETLDLIANNIANTGTSGYKADGESYDLYFGEDAWEGVNENRPADGEMPLIRSNWVNFTQGTLLPTGNQSDLALTSSGFFAVQSESGTLYTRAGHFRISKKGTLETPEGYELLATTGKPLQLDASKPFTISTSGQVVQEDTPKGSLQIVDVDSVDNLIKHGGTYFMLPPSGKVSPATNIEVVQGKVESSNVEATQAAVKLVGVLRQFEMLQRAVRIAGDMGKQAVEQVAKVGF